MTCTAGTRCLIFREPSPLQPQSSRLTSGTFQLSVQNPSPLQSEPFVCTAGNTYLHSRKLSTTRPEPFAPTSVHNRSLSPPHPVHVSCLRPEAFTSTVGTFHIYSRNTVRLSSGTFAAYQVVGTLHNVGTLHIYTREPSLLQPEPFISAVGTFHMSGQNPSQLQPDPFIPISALLYIYIPQPCTLTLQPAPLLCTNKRKPPPLASGIFSMYTRNNSLLQPEPLTSTS